MSPRVHPRSLKRALDLLLADPGRSWTVTSLATVVGVAPRTLQKHFNRFVGRSPMMYLRDVRFERARQEFVSSSTATTVTAIGNRLGLGHLGRFAVRYRQLYGETPSETLRKSSLSRLSSAMPRFSARLDRPVICVIPFDLVGEEAVSASGMSEEIAIALLNLRWIGVSLTDRARYHLRGKVRGNGKGRLRVTIILIDAASGRILWADHWEGTREEAFEFEHRVAHGIARVIEKVVRNVELDRAAHKDPDHRSAWELSMAALPGVLSYDAQAEGKSLELLERAMELAPGDPLPISLAAWCRGVRGCLHFSEQPRAEQEAARALAARAVMLNSADVLTETALAAGYTLAHDLQTAAIHAERALTLDSGSAWAWSRSGWVSAFAGDGATATARFRLARAIAPNDPLSSMCCFGIAAPLMQAKRDHQAIPWILRGIAELPRTSAWMSPFLAAAYALDGRKDDAKKCLAQWRRSYPGVATTQVRSGLPFGPALFDRVAEGLESAGIGRSL